MKLSLLVLLFSMTASAQVPSPTGGALGQAGSFPFRYGQAIQMTSDADYALAFPQTSAGFIKFTSSVSLTATRNVTGFPTCNTSNINFEIGAENSTTGGQILMLASTVPVANGQWGKATCDGTAYIPTGGGGGGAVASVTGAGTVTCSPTTGSVVCTGSGGGGSPAVTPLTGSGSLTITLTTTAVHYVITLSANCTITLATSTFTNVVQSAVIDIIPAGFTATLPLSPSYGGNVTWPGGFSPPLSTTVTSTVPFSYNGTTISGGA
jgi:hypothetical protein